MKRCTIDTRLTFDNGGGLNLNYPWGLFQSYLHEGQRLEIERGRFPIYLMFDSPVKGWGYLVDASGQSLYKFPLTELVMEDYMVYDFWNAGKEYIFEFRIVSFDDEQ